MRAKEQIETVLQIPPTKLHCDMRKECESPVTHIDEKGYIYCLAHGNERKHTHRCRKLKPAELAQLESGKPLRFY